jgi:uncharacterized protein (DUF58 family)
MSTASFIRTCWEKSLAKLRFLDNDALFRKNLLQADELLELKQRCLAITSKTNNPYETAHQNFGDARSAHRGYGLDYEESRPYQTGDDPRYIDWQLTARSGELFMKVYREERRPGVFVLVDRRASMRFGTHSRLKVTQAARAAACIAYTAQQRHVSLGGVILELNPHWVSFSHSKDSSIDLIHAASSPCLPYSSMAMELPNALDEEPGIADTLNMLREFLVPGSLVYLISDFMDLKEDHSASLMQLASKNHLSAIHVYDPAEMALPQTGALRFYSTQTNKRINVETDAAQTINAYRKTAENHFSKREEIFHALGIPYTLLSTHDDAIESKIPLF